MRDDITLVALVTRAGNGDQAAWDELVERYAPLVWAICRRYRLERPDVDDVAQNVWLRLVEQLPALREPAALPGWLATTTQRECLRVLRARTRFEQRTEPSEIDRMAAEHLVMIEEEIIAAEWNSALLAAFAQLPPRCRELLSLLMRDPPVPYAEISARLGISVGGIGPNRARCLARMRQYPALAAMLDVEPVGREGELDD